MKKEFYIITFITTVCLFSCGGPIYKIRDKDMSELEQTLINTELLIKKIDVIPNYLQEYATFYFSEKGVELMYSTLNFNPNDSIKDGIRNRNIQEYVDTCKTIPGLTSEEWILLKESLYKLRSYGVKGSNIAFCNDGRYLFFYYPYIYPDDSGGLLSTGHLAVLTDSIVNSHCFKVRFQIMDQKNGLFMIRRKI